jgi:hypothetical protein
LLSGSHLINKPQQLASGFPSANINQKITPIGQPLAPHLQILLSKQHATTYPPTEDESLMMDLAA